MEDDILDEIQEKNYERPDYIQILLVRTFVVFVMLHSISILTWLFPGLYEINFPFTGILIFGILVFNSRSIAIKYFKQNTVLQENKIGLTSGLSFLFGYLLLNLSLSIFYHLNGVSFGEIIPILLRAISLSVFAYLFTVSRVRKLFNKNFMSINYLILGFFVLLVLIVQIITRF